MSVSSASTIGRSSPRQTRPPLTSVDMNLTALGREAGLTLLSLVGGQAAEPGIRKLPCRLVVRQSCGRPLDG